MVKVKNRGIICNTFAKLRYHLCHYHVLFQNATLIHVLFQNATLCYITCCKTYIPNVRKQFCVKR
jgi:hypothetical protein